MEQTYFASISGKWLLKPFDPESITNKYRIGRGLIEPSNVDFNAPVVLVGKKDKTNIFCIDFWKLNALTKFDSQSITNKYWIGRGLIEPPNVDFNEPVVLVGGKDGTNRFCIDFRKLNVWTKFDPESIKNKDIIEIGLVEPSNVDFNAPVVLVGKRDRTNIFCIDFWKLNALTKFDSQSITNKYWIGRGLIEPPNVDFNEPVVLVGGKDGTNRFCIDFRKLNVWTKFDPESIKNRYNWNSFSRTI